MRPLTFGLRHAAAAALAAGLVGCATPDNGAAPGIGDGPAEPPAAAATPKADPAPAAAAPAPAAHANVPAQHWSLSERDKTLKAALQRWSQAAGWRLVWELGVDYRIGASASIDGTFETAITEVVKNMEHADVPMKAIFYRGNQVLRVVPRGME